MSGLGTTATSAGPRRTPDMTQPRLLTRAGRFVPCWLRAAPDLARQESDRSSRAPAPALLCLAAADRREPARRDGKTAPAPPVEARPGAAGRCRRAVRGRRRNTGAAARPSKVPAPPAAGAPRRTRLRMRWRRRKCIAQQRSSTYPRRLPCHRERPATVLLVRREIGATRPRARHHNPIIPAGGLEP